MTDDPSRPDSREGSPAPASVEEGQEGDGHSQDEEEGREWSRRSQKMAPSGHSDMCCQRALPLLFQCAGTLPSADTCTCSMTHPHTFCSLFSQEEEEEEEEDSDR